MGKTFVKQTGFTEKVSQKSTSKLKLDYESLAKYSSLGYYIAAPVIGFTLAGVFLDRYLDSKPLGTLVLLGVGSISSLYNAIKLGQELNRKDATHKH